MFTLVDIFAVLDTFSHSHDLLLHIFACVLQLISDMVVNAALSLGRMGLTPLLTHWGTFVLFAHSVCMCHFERNCSAALHSQFTEFVVHLPFYGNVFFSNVSRHQALRFTLLCASATLTKRINS